MALVFDDGASGGASNDSAMPGWGTPGVDVNAWGIGKKNGEGKLRACEYQAADGTFVRQWPLSELTADNILERWGPGEYRVAWWQIDPSNPDPTERSKPRGSGRYFRMADPPTVRAAAPSPAPSAPTRAPLVGGFAEALELMALIDSRANASQERTLQMAAAMAGRNNGGLDTQTLMLILNQQQAQTKELLATLQQQHDASLATVRTELASLRSAFEDEDEDGESESTASTVVKAAAPLFRPGKPAGEAVKAAALNYLAEHPDKVFDAIKTIPQALQALSSLAAQQQQAQQQQAQQQQRPRVAAVTPIRPVEAAAPPPPPVPGLNALAAQQPQQAPPSSSGPVTEAAPVVTP